MTGRNLANQLARVSLGLLLIALLAAPQCDTDVFAGPDQEVRLPLDWVDLDGSATGFQSDFDVAWSVVSSPSSGVALFSDAHALATRVTFSGPGEYVLELSVDGTSLGGDPATGSDEMMVSVLPELAAPVAHLSVDPSRGEAPRTVILDATGSHDPDGFIVSYDFDPGDGSAGIVSTTPTVSHRFERAGAYAVVLTVTDDVGLSATASAEVTIEDNPLRNGDFELGTGVEPDYWSTGSYGPGSAFSWETGAGRGGSHAVRITSPVPNDAWWRQDVLLTPNTPYNLHGWIRGTGIEGAGVGGNVCAVGTWDHSDSLVGDFDWRELSVTFVSNEVGEMTVGPRLGFWGSTPVGTVWADDLRLTSDDFAPPITGAHVALDLERTDLDMIEPAHLTRWLDHLDSTYRGLQYMVGEVPFDAERVGVLSVRQYPGGWAVAGNPIRWQQRYVAAQLMRADTLDDWSFGIMHELSHTFDLDGRWVWHAEFWANLKVFYVLETRDGRVVVEGILYEGPELQAFYRAAHDRAVATGVYDWNALTYRFIEVAHTVGWAPFKHTFRYFNALDAPDVPATPQAKLDLYLDRLGAYAGLDVRALFDEAELAWMDAQLE